MHKFLMSEDQLARLKKACQPVPYIIVGGIEPKTLQENANTAWQALGDQMGFDWLTAKPGDTLREFYAEPTKREPEPAPQDVEDWKDQIGGPGS
jgi:hypothetical protein